jgi:ketosteroid isomerase-like protein
MRKPTVALMASLLLLTACATTGSVTPERQRIDRLADAERAFAASAQTAGVNAAFLGAMADDATLFRPGPVNGKAFIGPRAEGPFKLEWQPQRVAVSTSDDFGYSSGPFRLTLNAKPEQPVYGQFFTVWRRGTDGRWQVLIDHGISHAGSLGWSSPFDAITSDGSSSTKPIATAEAEFARVSDTDGLIAAYRNHGSPRTRILRDEAAPFDGLAALAGMSASAARWTWTLTDSGTSRAGDFAWTMGRYRSRGPNDASSSGFYVRVWHVEQGDWKILGDVLAPIDEAVH